ncbi:hypothetical protein U1Q18_048712 [Sarracenia purpurea var. burkii]
MITWKWLLVSVDLASPLCGYTLRKFSEPYNFKGDFKYAIPLLFLFGKETISIDSSYFTHEDHIRALAASSSMLPSPVSHTAPAAFLQSSRLSYNENHVRRGDDSGSDGTDAQTSRPLSPATLALM